MLRYHGTLAAVIVTLLVYCKALPQQDSEINTGDRYGGSGYKTRHLKNSDGRGQRETRETHGYGLLPYLLARRHDYESSGSGKHEMWPAHKFADYGEGYLKRNFDEIDLSGLNNFVKKRNIDEIDHTLMPFPYAKRFYHPYEVNFLEMPGSFDKKRYRPDYPMDEIDLSQFPIGSKRSPNTSR